MSNASRGPNACLHCRIRTVLDGLLAAPSELTECCSSTFAGASITSCTSNSSNIVRGSMGCAPSSTATTEPSDVVSGWQQHGRRPSPMQPAVRPTRTPIVDNSDGAWAGLTAVAFEAVLQEELPVTPPPAYSAPHVLMYNRPESRPPSYYATFQGQRSWTNSGASRPESALIVQTGTPNPVLSQPPPSNSVVRSRLEQQRRRPRPLGWTGTPEHTKDLWPVQAGGAESRSVALTTQLLQQCLNDLLMAISRDDAHRVRQLCHNFSASHTLPAVTIASITLNFACGMQRISKMEL